MGGPESSQLHPALLMRFAALATFLRASRQASLLSPLRSQILLAARLIEARARHMVAQSAAASISLPAESSSEKSISSGNSHPPLGHAINHPDACQITVLLCTDSKHGQDSWQVLKWPCQRRALDSLTILTCLGEDRPELQPETRSNGLAANTDDMGRRNLLHVQGMSVIGLKR